MTRTHIRRIGVTSGLVLGIAGCGAGAAPPPSGQLTMSSQMSVSVAYDSTGQGIGRVSFTAKDCKMNPKTKVLDCTLGAMVTIDTSGQGDGGRTVPTAKP